VEALGALMLVAGVLLYGACAFSFAWLGRGTPSPTDYTRSLVAGPYRYSRNPMYVGVLLALIGEFILFGTSLPASIAYLIIFLLLVNLFIIAYEEPALRDKFGTEYDEYRRRVRRWF
jgi:protein-S-isoprenylcysteine O-methyltransferase Ste14